MASQDPICQAVNLSDSQPCTAVATTWENVFCRFHGKQCYGLYIGYKRRNAKLDALPSNVPSYLREAKVPLANETFEGVGDEKTLEEIHAHIYHEYVLLGKVIDARKLHHKHFYPVKLDYSHQAYIDTLSNRRYIVLRALERLETRTAQVLYEKEKWYTWIREVQKDEEATREKESKKVKFEAAMFKRHWSKMQTHLRVQREKKEKQIQDTYLETAYHERMSAVDSEDDAEMWDPIEDVLEDERSRYVDLIKHFLWMEVFAEVDENEKPTQKVNESSDPSADIAKLAISEDKPPKDGNKKSKSRAAKATSAPSSVKAQNNSVSSQDRRTGQSRIMELMDNDRGKNSDRLTDPDKSNIETEAEMRKRLKEGVEKNYGSPEDPMMLESIEVPRGTHLKTAPLTDEEIDSLTKDIKEIKLLLFCRLLLSHASLLPAAVRASSVEEFLNDPEIAESDLRDLCLKVEQPSLQDIRDACADLIRGDESETEDDGDIHEKESIEDVIFHEHRYGHLQEPEWFKNNIHAQGGKLIGNIKSDEISTKASPKKRHPRQQKTKVQACGNNKSDEMSKKAFLKKRHSRQQKMKVQVCGKSICNYSRESSMSRDGWLQFSVMAKDCDLKHAVQLCRNWDEFSQLNFLTGWQYFPASNWAAWACDLSTHSLHELGFFPYFKDMQALKHSHYHQVGARSQNRRQHNIVHARNIIVGYMRRNDSVTRRFLQYLTMRTGEVLVLVRDGKTGKIVTAPEKEHLWTMRRKEGLGRASKNEWDILLQVGPDYFDVVDAAREWRLGFEDYYDVWIWDFLPCQSSNSLYKVIASELRKAWRVTQPLDVYKHREPFLRSLTREKETMRVRSIQPGEQVRSLWDDVNDPNNVFITAEGQVHETTAKWCFSYNEADAAEDRVLFSDELINPNRNVPFKEVTTPITRAQTTPLNVTKSVAEGAREINKLDGDKSHLPDADTDTDADEDDEDDSGRVEGNRIKTRWTQLPLWEDAIAMIKHNHISSERKRLLREVGLLNESFQMIRGGINDLRGAFSAIVEELDPVMIEEKGSAGVLWEACRAGDLEPGAQEKHAETCEILGGILGSHQSTLSTDWVWFLVDILKWLELRTDYKTYTHDRQAGWPHPFIAQDIVKAFVLMAIFFPNLKVCLPVTDCFESEKGKEYSNSALLNPGERAKTIPDVRTRTSFKLRPKKFWKEWNDMFQPGQTQDQFYVHAYPVDRNAALRSIIAKLYLAGIVAPAYLDNLPIAVPGFAVANTEPHRPDKLDLFIDYADRYDAVRYRLTLPAPVPPGDWPDLLPAAQAFAAKNAGARFAILRVWSAPHFYPTVLGKDSERAVSFLDSAKRSWVWRFMPKDMPDSEVCMYSRIKMRLESLKQLQVGKRVIHRCEVILVMGADELDLLKYATAVTFAIQTKPWRSEIDPWKSFVNVDLGFLEGLDPYWLD